MSLTFAKEIENINGVLIVDAMNLGFRWKHSGESVFAEEYYNTVISFAASYKCSHIIIAADHRSSSYREKLFPEYKANRKLLRETQTDEDRDAFLVFIQEYERTLKYLEEQGLCVLRYDYTEADDIAAYLCSIIPDRNKWLISSDRDWDLLIDENTNRFSYVNRKETTLATWYDDPKNHPVSPELYLTLKCLDGDKGDNIPGIDQIGPKRATALIEQYGDIFDIYNALPISSKYKYIQNLNASAEQLLLNVELMDLVSFCREAIGIEACDDIDKIVGEYLL
jgi:5'-3' exonuclease